MIISLPGASPGHSNRSHGGLGSACSPKPPCAFHAGVEGGHPFAKPDLQLAWRTIKASRSSDQTASFGRMAVTQDHGAVGQAVIDEPVAVAVPWGLLPSGIEG